MNPLTIINEQFSKAAGDYDQHAFLQQQIADELFERAMAAPCQGAVLDVGIGTGYLVGKMRKQYPGIGLYGVDIALGMLRQAAKKFSPLYCVQADASYLPFRMRSFSAVISNATYQWVEDKQQAFGEVHRVLKQGGRFCCTVFGEQTLQELRTILQDRKKYNASDSFISFLSTKNIEELLCGAGFCDIRVISRLHRCYFDTVRELLQWLKNIGANRTRVASLYQGLSARKFIDGISDEYRRYYSENGAVFATFEIIFVEAQTK